MGFNQAPALPYRNLGIVEDGDTASQAIEKDKYIIWKGQNYFAKTDILQGETFVVDTNLTAMPEGVINGIVDTLNASTTLSVTGLNTEIDISSFDWKRIVFNVFGKYSSEAVCRCATGEILRDALDAAPADMSVGISSYPSPDRPYVANIVCGRNYIKTNDFKIYGNALTPTLVIKVYT